MLLGDLPDLRETQSGKDLIQIGTIEGMQKSLLLQLKTKFGSIATEIQERIQRLDSEEKLNDLLVQILKVDSVDQIKW